MEMLSLIERDEEWEIPLANLAFIKNLGSGNFGEVQLAYLSPDIVNERAKNYIEKTKYRNPCIPPNLVAVKRLKGIKYNVKSICSAVSWVKINTIYS